MRARWESHHRPDLAEPSGVLQGSDCAVGERKSQELEAGRSQAAGMLAFSSRLSASFRAAPRYDVLDHSRGEARFPDVVAALEYHQFLRFMRSGEGIARIADRHERVGVAVHE